MAIEDRNRIYLPQQQGIVVYMEKEREESRLKLREMYRGKYLDTLKSESHQKYMEMLEKLSEIK